MRKILGIFASQMRKIIDTAINLAVSHSNSPLVSVYLMNSNGFVSKFNDPSIGLSGTSSGKVAFSKSKKFIAASTPSSPYIAAYNWSSSGFGTSRLAPSNPVPLAQLNDFDFHPSDTFIVYSHSQTFTSGESYLGALAFSSSGVFGSKYINYNTPPSASINSVRFNPAGNVVVGVPGNSSGALAYQWINTGASTGFGTKFLDPTNFANGIKLGVDFHPSGDYIAVSLSVSPFFKVIEISTTGFGSQISEPSSLPPNSGIATAFSRNGQYLAITHQSTPYIAVYEWLGSSLGSKIADPVTALPSQTNPSGKNVDFSVDDKFIAISLRNSPYMIAYSWADGFGTQFTPVTLPTGLGRSVDFN